MKLKWLGMKQNEIEEKGRVKCIQDSWDAVFVYDWQPPLIFVQLTSNFLGMCTYCTAHAQEVLYKSDKY